MAESSQLTSHKKQISGRVLRNTADLVDTMEDVVLHDDEILVSYDVKSLFTSIPVNESVDLCEQRLLDDDSLSDRTSLDGPL